MTSNSNNHSPYVEKMFLMEGVLTELHVELGKENLLARIDAHYKERSIVTGLGAVVGDLFGQTASAATLAMYEGEETQSFACLIGDRAVYGQFAGAEYLKAGNSVRAVVVAREGILYASALMDEERGYLWIGHAWGKSAEMMANFKLAFWGFISLMAFAALFGWAFGGIDDSYYRMLELSAVCGFVVCFGMALWVNRDMRGLADPSTEMFRLLGFSEPEKINLNSYRIQIVEFRATSGKAEFQARDVFCYKRAIEDGAIAMTSIR